jgi:hypothetical protein
MQLASAVLLPELEEDEVVLVGEDVGSVAVAEGEGLSAGVADGKEVGVFDGRGVGLEVGREVVLGERVVVAWGIKGFVLVS